MSAFNWRDEYEKEFLEGASDALVKAHKHHNRFHDIDCMVKMTAQLKSCDCFVYQTSLQKDFA